MKLRVEVRRGPTVLLKVRPLTSDLFLKPPMTLPPLLTCLSCLFSLYRLPRRPEPAEVAAAFVAGVQSVGAAGWRGGGGGSASGPQEQPPVHDPEESSVVGAFRQ